MLIAGETKRNLIICTYNVLRLSYGFGLSEKKGHISVL